LGYSLKNLAIFFSKRLVTLVPFHFQASNLRLDDAASHRGSLKAPPALIYFDNVYGFTKFFTAKCDYNVDPKSVARSSKDSLLQNVFLEDKVLKLFFDTKLALESTIFALLVVFLHLYLQQ
jgi:hypothetical protein